MKSYDVALWRWWPSKWPDYTEVVEEFSPGLAVFALMRRVGLRYVEKAVVVEVVRRPEHEVPGSPLRCWRGVAPIKRFVHVVCPREEACVDD